MMKEKDVVSSKDLMQFINNTLKLNLKKREQHALIVLWDTNQNNTITKEEFWELIKKGQRLVDAPPTPMNNNFLDPAADSDPNPSKNRVTTDDSMADYSGNAKEEIIRIITESEAISIEQYFQVNCGWSENDSVTFDKFVSKCKVVFKKIPQNDIKDLFDEFDLLGNGRMKLSNLYKDLK